MDTHPLWICSPARFSKNRGFGPFHLELTQDPEPAPFLTGASRVMDALALEASVIVEDKMNMNQVEAYSSLEAMDLNEGHSTQSFLPIWHRQSTLPVRLSMVMLPPFLTNGNRRSI